ncbi:DUF5690 family protein [uncultured Arcticibacterium sp.]|uniref:DUF5690 family protein n=1 Tax=uncultured Arcticibacterium sp. TaxID=2173042 RepID=UPI0030FACB65
MKNQVITNALSRNKTLFILWAVIATFGAYFCTYAFRKPYTTGTFEGFFFGEMEYKTVIIIAQVIGYMLSKFLGIKIISELKAKQRILLIISLILIALLSLTLFAFIPAPYNILFMFMNGLPLGMVWGVIFSFLEGRRLTELLGMALSVNMIITSGILKSTYLFIQNSLGFSDFQMPLVMGCTFLPFFLLSVWMLSKLPPPTQAEKLSKMSRKAMTKKEKREVWQQLFPGLSLLIISYALFTTLRDFRDNFAVEIWQSLDATIDISIFAKTESLIGIIVMSLIALLVLIKSNRKAYRFINLAMIISLFGLLLSTVLFKQGQLSPFSWLVSQGISFYLPYLLIQIAFFERLIPILKINSNAGYFVYLCDSVGYLGSVVLLFYKEFLATNLNYKELLVNFSYGTALVGLALIIGQYLFFSYLVNQKNKVSNLVQTVN